MHNVKVKKDYVVGGLLFVLVALFFIVPSFELGIVNTLLGESSLGAGVFPFLLGAAVALCGIILIAEGFHRETHMGGSSEGALTREELRKNSQVAILTMLALTVALLLWNVIGFYPMLVVMCLAMNYLFKEKLLTNVILTVCLIGFVYAAFTLGLRIRFQV